MPGFWLLASGFLFLFSAVDAIMEKDSDHRFALTDWERKGVIRLKEACDQEDIKYCSIFELAKYVLVSKSVAKDDSKKADDKRLKEALRRIKKRGEWEKRLKVDNIDPIEAYHEINRLHPGYFICRYPKDKDGHIIVGYHHALAPTSFVAENKRNAVKFVAMVLLRFDLAAADMEEARCGIALAGITEEKGTLVLALKYLRMIFAIQDCMKDMHCHRIRKIYSELPSFTAHLIRPALSILPKKLVERNIISPNLSELEEKYLGQSVSEDEVTPEQWMAEKSLRYNETLQKLKL